MTSQGAVQPQLVWQYEGNGLFQNDPSLPPVQCIFEVYQSSNGNIRLRCEADVYESWDHLARGPQVNLRLEGITKGGAPILITGPALQYNHTVTAYKDRAPDPAQIYYVIHGENRVQIGTPTWVGAANVRFALTNFTFLGTEAEKTETGTKLNSLKLNIANKEILIRKVADYDAHLIQLENIGGICITCEAQITIASEERSSMEGVINNLCQLLSIASGTLVSWLYFEVLSVENELIYRTHRSAITRNFVSQSLIDPRQMQDVKQFVETTYDNYVKLLITHRMTQVVHSFVEARGVNFLEARGLIILSLVDYLTGVLVDSTGNANLIPPTLFSAGCGEFEQLVIAAADKAYSGIDKSTRQVLVMQCTRNFQTFRRKLKEFCSVYKVPKSNKEIPQFIDNRNNLTHRAVFTTADEYGELCKMLSLLDRMILRLLDYRGPYLNCITWDREIL